MGLGGGTTTWGEWGAARVVCGREGGGSKAASMPIGPINYLNAKYKGQSDVSYTADTRKELMTSYDMSIADGRALPNDGLAQLQSRGFVLVPFLSEVAADLGCVENPDHYKTPDQLATPESDLALNLAAVQQRRTGSRHIAGSRRSRPQRRPHPDGQRLSAPRELAGWAVVLFDPLDDAGELVRPLPVS